MAPGVNGEQLLQSSSSEAQAGDKLPSIGGVLCLSCGNFGCSVPVEDAPFHGLFEDDQEDKQKL